MPLRNNKPSNYMHKAPLTLPLPLTSAPPPLHSVILVATLLSIVLYSLPSLSSLEHAASLDLFVTTEFDVGPVSTMLALGCVRLAFSALILSTTLYVVLFEPFTVMSTYLPQSKLQSGVIYFEGFMTLAPFTVWSWILLGVSFLLNGMIPILVSYGYDLEESSSSSSLSLSLSNNNVYLYNNWLRQLALVSFEVAAPTAMLVSVVVRYAIWPDNLESTGHTNGLRKTTTLLMHNANTIMVLVEIGLLGTLPVRYSDAALAPLFGIIYLLFSWSMSGRWTNVKPFTPSPNNNNNIKDNDDDKVVKCTTTALGPQFIYFFLDTTLGYTTSYAILALLTVLMAVYGIFGTIDHILVQYLGGGFLTHLTVVVALASLVCRFRD
eukprot:CAMPEP_0198286986 /NCGR_PEP_ID=MMETSP1449-20131203/5940_1 /TAXON_ID=420275 /ORGANISM="Attheya septentrionalis, Strain CCMP2084" /LENGTH=378 /DNA_ID=CAMNT_0043984863 /DNA_START=114 /DNA_END=1250 /DNA_ORIENTATION=-